MSRESILIAKVAGLKKNFEGVRYGFQNRVFGLEVEPLFPIYTTVTNSLKEINPEVYGDLPILVIPEVAGHAQGGTLYDGFRIKPFINNLEYILEVSSNVRIGEKKEGEAKTNRVFISHGRSKEWYKLQNFLEKDYGVPSLELAQEPNLGRTVLQKLSEEAEKCSVAIIVMTGDDIAADGEVRARENVMHEIGYFQAKYGLSNIILLHENDVNIPSNIHGLVYIPFPKDTIEATFGAIGRELKVMLA